MEFNKPEALLLTGNISENFKRFKQEIKFIFWRQKQIRSLKKFKLRVC